MGVEGAIIEKVQSLFDAAGVSSYSGVSLLILGLLTTPHQDLDDFFREEPGSFRLRGFELHAQPRLDALLRFIRGLGLTAELWGRFGYPQGEELNLKQRAVAAGLGRWGKNSLVLHPQFGPWVRFMAMKVQAPLTPTGPGNDSHEENPLCEGCTACINACPARVLEPYQLRDWASCQASTSSFPQMGKLVACDRCLVVCPIGR
jgi:ferredoxin